MWNYTHVRWKRNIIQMRISVAYQKQCKIVLFILISNDKCNI